MRYFIMKKVTQALFLVVAAFGISGCALIAKTVKNLVGGEGTESSSIWSYYSGGGNTKSSTSYESQSQESYGPQSSISYSDSSTPLDPNETITLAGQFCSNDGWNAVDWKYTTQGEMSPSSASYIQNYVDWNVGSTLLNRSGLKDVFIYRGAHFGSTEVGYAGWTTRALIDGSVVTMDGGYCVKAIECTYDEEDDKWLTSQWIPDPRTACVENLTPNTLFMPTWQEEPDYYGFAWNDNPVVIGGAGEYTVVLARYNSMPSGSRTDSYNYAMALIKTSYEDEYVPPVIENHTFGLIGTFTNWEYDIEMTEIDTNYYYIERAFYAGDEFKIRADASWSWSWGYESVYYCESSAVEDFGGNIRINSYAYLAIYFEIYLDSGNDISGAEIRIIPA